MANDDDDRDDDVADDIDPDGKLKKLSDEEKAVLDEIAQADEDNQLKPEAVVAAARDPESPLHRKFEWNDEKAAIQHRLNQARSLIRAYVTIVPNIPRPVRAYISTPFDRNNGLGYQPVKKVLHSQQYTLDALKEIKARIKTFESSTYAHVVALFPMWKKLLAIVGEYEEEIQSKDKNRPES